MQHRERVVMVVTRHGTETTVGHVGRTWGRVTGREDCEERFLSAALPWYTDAAVPSVYISRLAGGNA